jgi:hypothetical protein
MQDHPWAWEIHITQKYLYFTNWTISRIRIVLVVHFIKSVCYEFELLLLMELLLCMLKLVLKLPCIVKIYKYHAETRVETATYKEILQVSC